MPPRIQKKHLILFAYLCLIAYLVINTGIISDDFDAINRSRGKSFKEIIIPNENFYFVETPAEYFTHFIWYHFIRPDSLFVINILKILFIFLSFYLISKFFEIFLDTARAYFVSFLFIFFPSHDSTVYCFMLQYLTLSFAFYLYAFYLAYHNKLLFAFLSALVASFVSYGSPPVAIALFFLFILRKQLKKGLIIFIPNALYVSYYIFISKIAMIGTDKTAGWIEIHSLVKQFVLQITTFIDAVVGPSMWLKIYYSFSQLSVFSWIIGILCAAIFYKTFNKNNDRMDKGLIVSFLFMALLSFGLFSVTGRYPQIAFNLGNRVTIFGSLLLTYILFLASMPHKLKTVIIALMIFSILGISDHWKGWNVQQQRVIANIKNNRALNDYRDTRRVYVSGNQYSKFGPISHIEFLSEGYVTAPLFQLALGSNISANPINNNLRFEDGYLIDTRYGIKYKVHNYINVYDSQNDTFFSLDPKEINSYIDSLPKEKRHWVQLVRIPILKKAILKLMPRLRHTL